MNVAHVPDVNQVPRPMMHPRLWFSVKTLRFPLPSNGVPVGGDGAGTVGSERGLLGR